MDDEAPEEQKPDEQEEVGAAQSSARGTPEGRFVFLSRSVLGSGNAWGAAEQLSPGGGRPWETPHVPFRSPPAGQRRRPVAVLAPAQPSALMRAPLLQPDITSTPNFVVEVIKDDTKQTLVLDCHYPEDEVSGALRAFPALCCSGAVPLLFAASFFFSPNTEALCF